MDNEVMLTNATETIITLNLPFGNAHFLELLQVSGAVCTLDSCLRVLMGNLYQTRQVCLDRMRIGSVAWLGCLRIDGILVHLSRFYF